MQDFSLANSNILAVAFYMTITSMVDWIKVLEVCVSNRTTLMSLQAPSISLFSLLPPMSSHCSYPSFHPLAISFNVISDYHHGAPLHVILLLASLMSSFLSPSISSPYSRLPCQILLHNPSMSSTCILSMSCC